MLENKTSQNMFMMLIGIILLINNSC